MYGSRAKQMDLVQSKRKLNIQILLSYIPKKWSRESKANGYSSKKKKVKYSNSVILFSKKVVSLSLSGDLLSFFRKKKIGDLLRLKM